MEESFSNMIKIFSLSPKLSPKKQIRPKKKSFNIIENKTKETVKKRKNKS